MECVKDKDEFLRTQLSGLEGVIANSNSTFRADMENIKIFAIVSSAVVFATLASATYVGC